MITVYPRPTIDKARDSIFSLILLAADSLLYNAVSTIRYLFFVTLHVNRKHCHNTQCFLHAKWQKWGIVLWILHCKATSRPQVTWGWRCCLWPCLCKSLPLFQCCRSLPVSSLLKCWGVTLDDKPLRNISGRCHPHSRRKGRPHDCAHTYLSPHDCAQTRLCRHMSVPRHDCAHTCLCPDTFVPWHVIVVWSQSWHIWYPDRLTCFNKITKYSRRNTAADCWTLVK